MFTRRTIPFIIGSILLVAVAFLFLTRTLDWTYVSDLYKDEPAVVVAPDTVPIETVELEIGVMLPEEQYNELLTLSQRVVERYPYIHVKINNFYNEQLTFEEWQRLAQLGNLGDIQLVHNEWVVPLAIQGLFQPVDRLMNNDVLSDQLHSIIDALKWNGYMWAVPYETNPYMLFMHKEAYDGEENSDMTVIQSPPIALDDSLALKDVAPPSPPATEEAASDHESDIDWGFEHWLERYEQSESFEGPFMSIDPERIAGLLALLSTWDKDIGEPMNLGLLNEEQYKALQYLQEHSELVQLDTVLDEQTMPFLYMTTVKQYYEQKELIDAHYVSSKALAPLPWMNGQSFMMSAGTKDAAAAMLWLETINRYQPKGTVIHRKIYASYSSDSMQRILVESLQQKLVASQLFHFDLEWVKRYEQLEQAWTSLNSVRDKLAVLLRENDEHGNQTNNH